MARRTKGRLTKDEHTDLYRKNSMISLYFNRYLMIRYFLAIFFFANFFWAAMVWGHWSAWIPSILFLLSVYPAFQLGFMWGKRSEINTEATQWFFRIQTVACIGMMILSWTAPMNQIYPAFTDTTSSRLVLFGIFTLGLILCLLVLRRFSQINKNTDKQYGRIQFFENKYKIKAGRK